MTILPNQYNTPHLWTNNNDIFNMEGQIRKDSSAPKAGFFHTFYSSASSRTTSPKDSQSEKTSIDNQSTSGSESPPDSVDNICSGLSSGCYLHDQPHCHLRCSPRACKQCREVLDADWIEKGRWLEDCISSEEEDEQRRGDKGSTTGPGFKKVLTIAAFAAFVAGFLYYTWKARSNWGLFQEWAAT